MELQERITNKENQIKKLVLKYDKYSKLVSEEFLTLCNQFLRTGDRTQIREYTARVNPRFKWLDGPDEDLYRTASDLYDARNTLDRYLKQLKAEEDKQATLSELPEVIIEFKENLITRWDRYDLWKQNEIKKDRAILTPKEMREKWGHHYFDFIYYTSEEIHKSNVKDAEELVLNLINRTIEITGQITDCSYLYLDQDNSGYTIINGLVIGKNGKARVESIGAGGYNIQRYHIRVLVKEVRE